MQIRFKIIFVVLPLVVAPLFVLALSSIFTARNGITEVATRFQRFKAEELSKYAQNQWTILQENGLSGRQEYVDIAKAAIESFARSMERSGADLIFAVDRSGAIVMKTADVLPTSEEARVLASLAARGEEGWHKVKVGGVERVGQAVSVAPFGWYVLVTSTEDSFYRASNQILFQSVFVLGISAPFSIVLLVLFSGYLIRPLRAVVGAMRGIIASDDLSKRVDLLYRDETGELGHTFNIMTSRLERAYDQIKGFALETAIARKREHKIRSIFQKYVPNEVIEAYFRKPESMLTGENRALAILFSDIRGFTSISERMKPDELVEVLNEYFGLMVDAVMSRGGIVDKYIGDAVMAFFGAPVMHEDDAVQSVMAAFDMMDALARFNVEQAERHPPFRVGIGINYGLVTVGNIGSEKKMDYTVIGDSVNLASRLEGLTKIYGEPLIISESMHQSVEAHLPCRMLDRVAVKGRTEGVRIYAVRRELGPAEKEGWELHQEGIDFYYGREFGKALDCFDKVLQFLPGDAICARFAERCRAHAGNSPGPEWEGVEVITEK